MMKGSCPMHIQGSIYCWQRPSSKIRGGGSSPPSMQQVQCTKVGGHESPVVLYVPEYCTVLDERRGRMTIAGSDCHQFVLPAVHHVDAPALLIDTLGVPRPTCDNCRAA